MHGLSPSELKLLRGLRTPEKIQNFLDTLPTNYEPKGETCMSPRRVLRERTAHCMEGAMLAAAALRVNGHMPWVMDLKVTGPDDDHVVAPFVYKGHYGAISKTNHYTVRYRDPIYTTLRELVMSYFHEYTDNDGKKILRSYSHPVDLSRFDTRGWMTDEKDVFYIPQYLDKVKHIALIAKAQASVLRRVDRVERKLGRMLEWNRDGTRRA